MLVDSRTQIDLSSSFEIKQRTFLATRQHSQRVALSPLLKTETVLGVSNMALSNNHVIRKLLFPHFFLSSDPVKENVLIWF